MMRHKYFAGFQLAALHTLPALPGICLVQGVSQLGLFYWMLHQGGGTTSFIVLIENSWWDIIFCVALLGMLCASILKGLGKGNSGYLARRLALKDSQLGLLWSGNVFLCLVIVWGWEVVLLLCAHLLFQLGIPADYWSHQSFFIDCYRSDFLHLVLPMGDVVLWIRNLVILVSLSLTSGYAVVKHWRGEQSKLWGAFYSASQGEVAVMEPFVSVLGWCLAIFPLLALFCLSYIAIYYQMHLPSLYLMRRLPDRWSLCRRCVVIPLTMAVVTMVIAGLLLLIFYWLYCAVTPDGYFVEGQLKMLVGAWFRGESQWTT